MVQSLSRLSQPSLGIRKSLEEHYANYYSGEEGLSEWRQLGATDKAKNIIEMCTTFPHQEILEIGCGDGAVLEKLAAAAFGTRFTGVEISPSAIRWAREKQIPNTEVKPFNGAEIPFQNHTFDLAILTHVLEHVEYPRQLLYEAARVAKCVFVEVPLEDNARLRKDFVFDPVGHINFYNPRSIRHLIQSCGFKVLSAKLTHSSLPLYIYRKSGLRGCFAYALKEIGLKCSPCLATHMFTYHCAMVCAGKETE